MATVTKTRSTVSTKAPAKVRTADDMGFDLEDDDEPEDFAWPDVTDVAEELREINEGTVSAEDADEIDGIEVHLQVTDSGNWKVHAGSSQYLTDHDGYFGYGIVPGNGEDFDAEALAAELIDEAQEDAASAKEASTTEGRLALARELVAVARRIHERSLRKERSAADLSSTMKPLMDAVSDMSAAIDAVIQASFKSEPTEANKILQSLIAILDLEIRDYQEVISETRKQLNTITVPEVAASTKEADGSPELRSLSIGLYKDIVGKAGKEVAQAIQQALTNAFELGRGAKSAHVGIQDPKLLAAVALNHQKASAPKTASFDSFFQAYVDAALWSSTDNSDDNGGESLDANYSQSDIAPETINQMKEDCRAFMQREQSLLMFLDDEQAGHDFWLSRNGHGAGFFDLDKHQMDEGAPADLPDALQKAARSFGEFNLYVGDDGLIYGA